MHYLITGHTGFKGSWLSLMLEAKGHSISGISLNPPEKSLFNQSELSTIFEHDLRIDIRDRSAIRNAFEKINPDILIHLAAQPLVRESYRLPIETFEINVIGTLNVLEATRGLENLKAGLIITTDKVYKNHNQLRGYREVDELGGDDPYSSSKAAADIATQSWIKNFAEVPMAIARAGNVIGGGDWALDRIIPDLVNAYSARNTPVIRSPNAIRPWQHVLDCLNGYLLLVDASVTYGITGEWNFGPTLQESKTVTEVVSEFASVWGIDFDPWKLDEKQNPHETGYLLLDSTKSRNLLDWKDKLNFKDTIKWTSDWYKSSIGQKPVDMTRKQILDFLDLT